jgi:thioesterase domain-containing protein
MNAFESVAAHYEPHAYDGRVTLFRAESIEAVYRHTGPMLGWEGLIPHLDVIEVPGDHDSLVLDPNVQTLARHLTRQIAEAAGAA